MGYDTTGAGGYVYTCGHTGERFMGADLASAKALALRCSPNCDGTAAYATDPLTGQRVLETSLLSPLTGVYQGAQTGTQVRVQANTAGLYDTSLPDINTFGIGDVQAQAFRIFQNEALEDAGVLYATPSNSPGSDNEPPYVRSNNVVSSGTVLNSQNTAGVGASGAGAVSTIADGIKGLPLMLIAIIGIGLLFIFMMGKGLTGKVTG
jgi:hypothetical protein